MKPSITREMIKEVMRDEKVEKEDTRDWLKQYDEREELKAEFDKDYETLQKELKGLKEAIDGVSDNAELKEAGQQLYDYLKQSSEVDEEMVKSIYKELTEIDEAYYKTADEINRVKAEIYNNDGLKDDIDNVLKESEEHLENVEDAIKELESLLEEGDEAAIKEALEEGDMESPEELEKILQEFRDIASRYKESIRSLREKQENFEKGL